MEGSLAQKCPSLYIRHNLKIFLIGCLNDPRKMTLGICFLKFEGFFFSKNLNLSLYPMENQKRSETEWNVGLTGGNVIYMEYFWPLAFQHSRSFGGSFGALAIFPKIRFLKHCFFHKSKQNIFRLLWIIYSMVLTNLCLECLKYKF